MKFKHKLIFALTGAFLCCSTVSLPSGKLIAATRWQNTGKLIDQNQGIILLILNKFSHGKEQKIIPQLILPSPTNKFSKHDFKQQTALFNDSISLLMRLLIIGSFGPVAIAGRHSLMQRYIQIYNQNAIVIISGIIFLLLLLIGSNIILFIF